ncbi:MAG: DUF2911 domain-containing protein [Terriglobia bacterium]|jgi:hypothetical protein|nr:DUF2911 domain-containing protein [Terriglobia bacterium]
MRRLFLFTVLICSLSLANIAFAGDSKSSPPSEQVTSCNFDNGNQVAVRYLPVTAKKSEGFGRSVRYGTVWTPDNQAMVMFNSGPTAIENKDLAAGAYTLYLMPNKNDWTLIVSKETDTKTKYDASKDVARIPMDIGDLPSTHNTFEVFLGKTGPNRCSLRIYWQDKGAFATIDGK